jgi:hypothetical protein
MVVALAAALLVALTTSPQHHAPNRAPAPVSGGPRLMTHLLRHPRWLIGQATRVLGFMLRATAGEDVWL